MEGHKAKRQPSSTSQNMAMQMVSPKKIGFYDHPLYMFMEDYWEEKCLTYSGKAVLTGILPISSADYYNKRRKEAKPQNHICSQELRPRKQNITEEA